MMKCNRIISTMLAVMMIFGSLVGVLPFLVVPAEASTVVTFPVANGEEVAKENLNQTYLSARDKINRDPYMQLYATKGQYNLYANIFTGEVYAEDTLSGQVLTTNPYYIGDEYGTDTIPKELMSQFELVFTTKEGTQLVYNSYDWSSSRGQIYPTLFKDGIRLEYTVGDTTARYVVPNGISRERFESLIIIPAQQYLISLIQEMVLQKRGAIDDSKTTEEKIVYDNDDELKALCEWADKNQYQVNYNKAPVKWGFEDVMAYFYSFDPEKVPEGTNVISAFDTWYRLAYIYYKVLCGNNGKNYREYSKMGNNTADYFSLVTMYQLQDPNEAKSEQLRQDMFETYPATRRQDEDGKWFALYALDNTLSNAKKRGLQQTIAKYSPNYTIDMMYEDEAETELEPAVEINPVFRLALEYQLTDTGMTVTLPASSIFYDETLYSLVEIDILRYMGADDMRRGGYVFYPDGSGTLIDFDDFAHKNITISGNVYGQDYSFHAVTGANQQSIRMPVYGATTNKTIYYVDNIYHKEDPTNPDIPALIYLTEETYLSGAFSYVLKEKKIDEVKDADGNIITAAYYQFYFEGAGGQMIDLPYGTDGRQYYLNERNERVYLSSGRGLPSNVPTITVTELHTQNFTDGYLAILEDGASLCTMNVEINGASNNHYAAVFPSFRPLPQDTYDLSETTPGSDSVMFTVSSKEKYMDDMTIRYVILTDETIAKETAGINGEYVSSYVGMANVYRDYLTKEVNVLLDMVNDDVMSQLPLYIETFGVMDTIEKILTIPVEVKVALTSFEDVQKMHQELSAAGISNVKFRLKGYTNGGMFSNYPAKLKWERKAGGKSGLKDLLSYVSSQAAAGMEIYPDFEFQYVQGTALFDGIRWKKVAARTVDNRYAIKRLYSPVTQEYDSMAEGVIVAPTEITRLFDKFNKKYSKLDMTTISLGTMAGELSSSYDEDETLIREDAMQQMVAFLAGVSEDYSVMSSGGNIYALKHIDHLLNAPIDSSHFRVTSNTIPFFGMVVHGALSYAGGPLNEEGNPDYTLLRSIESGASLYFILSYANTKLMKEDPLLSDYYSVDYQIWKGDVIAYYKKLNTAIGDLQDYVIKNHEFITAERVKNDEAAQSKEEISNRNLLEAEYLAAFDAHVDFVMDTAKNDMRVLREFFLFSASEFAKEDVKAWGAAEEEKGNSPTTAEMDAQRKVFEKEYEDNYYSKYLPRLAEDPFRFHGLMTSKIQTMHLQGSVLLGYVGIDIKEGEVATRAHAEQMMNAIVFYVLDGDPSNDSRTICIKSGQEFAMSIDEIKICEQALRIFGLEAPFDYANIPALIANPQDFADQLPADFLLFLDELLQRCDEIEEGVPFIPAGADDADGDGIFVLPEKGNVKFDELALTLDVERVEYESAYRFVTDSFAQDEDYVPTIYTIADGSVVIVTYVKGDHSVRFVLNYNMFSVRVNIEGEDEFVLGPQDFHRLDQ